MLLAGYDWNMFQPMSRALARQVWKASSEKKSTDSYTDCPECWYRDETNHESDMGYIGSNMIVDHSTRATYLIALWLADISHPSCPLDAPVKCFLPASWALYDIGLERIASTCRQL